MKIIVDTNILFSAMLSQNSHLRQTLNNQELEIFAPNYIFLELPFVSRLRSKGNIEMSPLNNKRITGN